jgi:pimeloyl-ACP methyl ester carboxylesterase
VPRVHANGIDIYYERRGSGPRLLYFQGSGQTLARSGIMVDGFAERFDVVAFDQRGLGQTEIPAGPYEMADYAADAAALLDAIGWDSCRAVGVSFGGMVAQEFAVTWPERVERLALVCTSPGGDFASYPLHELAEMPLDDAQALRPKLLDGRFTPEYLAAHDDARALVEMISSMEAAGDSDDEVRRGEAAQLDARSRFDALGRLGEIGSPTLVAAGRYDYIAPPRNAEKLAALIPDADLRFYEGGHVFFLQDPQAIPDVVDFLAAGAG